MPVLLSLLAPGCQTQPRLTEVTRQQHSSPHQSHGPAHLCLHRRLSSEGSWEPTLTEQAALKWAWGTACKFPLTLMFWQSDRQWLRADMGWQWRGVWGFLMKRKDIRLVACMSLGRMLTPVCHPSLTVLRMSSAHIRMRPTVNAHRGVLLSWPSALSDTQISI